MFTKWIQLLSRWQLKWMFVVPIGATVCCHLKGKRKNIKQLLQNFFQTSMLLNSLHYLHSNTMQAERWLPQACHWVTDWLLPRRLCFAHVRNRTGPQDHRGGDGRLMRLSFTTSSLLFSPLSLVDSLTSSHLLLLLLICRVFIALGKFERKEKHCVLKCDCVLNIHTDWFGSVSVRFIILNAIGGLCLIFFSGSSCSATTGQQDSMVSFQSA